MEVQNGCKMQVLHAGVAWSGHFWRGTWENAARCIQLVVMLLAELSFCVCVCLLPDWLLSVEEGSACGDKHGGMWLHQP